MDWLLDNSYIGGKKEVYLPSTMFQTSIWDLDDELIQDLLN